MDFKRGIIILIKGYKFMRIVWKILRTILFVAYLFVVGFFLFHYEKFTELYHLSQNTIPIAAGATFLLIGFNHLRLLIKTDRLEHEFSTIVNHTFRTPLTRVMWIAEELKKDMTQNERSLAVQNLTNATGRVLEIVDLMVGTKNINSTAGYDFEAVSIRTVIEKSIAKYREEINKRNIKFTVPIFEDMPLLTIDLKKISFVVDSLIENSVFYTRNGGQIEIRCEASSKRLKLAVIDTGIGLNLMEKLRIFSRFYRGHEAYRLNTDGMGLKLYLSKQIIKRHKGKIYAKSRGRNKGSVFTVELPFSR